MLPDSVPVYYSNEEVGIYIVCGDALKIVPLLDPVDCILTDPPYNQTSLDWDRWPTGWLSIAASALKPTGSMWCFGTLRMFMTYAVEFMASGFKLAQDIAGKDIDILWEKQNGSGFQSDRFRRVHEQVAHFYLGKWTDTYRDVQYTMDATKKTVRSKKRPPHLGKIGPRPVFRSHDGGPRMMRSVIAIKNMHGKAQNATEKPVGLIGPMMNYACPRGSVVLDMFCGAGPVLEVAKRTGRKAIGIDIRPDQCRIAADRVEGIDADLFTKQLLGMRSREAHSFRGGRNGPR